VIFEPGERYRLRNLTKHQLVKGTVHPYRGEWIEFDVEQKPGKDVTAGTRVARKRRLSIFILMRALGYGEDRCPGFMDAFVRHFDFLEGQWEKDREIAPTREEALVEIYKRARPGEPPSVESARAYFDNAFFQNRRYDLSRVGRYKLDKKLRNEIERLGELFPMLNGADEDGMPFLDRPEEGQPVLSRCEVLAACTYLLNLGQGRAGLPPRRPGPLRQPPHPLGRRADPEPGAHRPQRMERVVKERMTTQDVEAITPQTLINIRPVVAAIKEFFGTSQLSQFMDQVNPLSGSPTAAASRRSALAACPVSAPASRSATSTSRTTAACARSRRRKGPNIGLIGALATFARVNEFGFIESPYRKSSNGKVTDEIVYLAADEEEEYVVAQANDAAERRRHVQGRAVLVRRSPQARHART
jgi:DNA-directed RNA polymerase subunit beta